MSAKYPQIVFGAGCDAARRRVPLGGGAHMGVFNERCLAPRSSCRPGRARIVARTTMIWRDRRAVLLVHCFAGSCSSGRFCHRYAEPQQPLRVAGQDLLAFARRARQVIDELPGDAGRSVWVVGAEQEPAGAELGAAVLQRPGPVADGVDVELVQVVANRPGQPRWGWEQRAGLAVDAKTFP